MDELKFKLTVDDITRLIVEMHKDAETFDPRLVKMAVQAAVMIGIEKATHSQTQLNNTN